MQRPYFDQAEFDLLDAISGVTDVASLDALAQRGAEAAGMDGYYLATFDPLNGIRTMDRRSHEWLDHYTNEGFFAFDPVHRANCGKAGAFTWDECYNASDLSRRAFGKLREANDFGMANSFNVKMKKSAVRQGVFCFYSDNNTRFYGNLRRNRAHMAGLAEAIYNQYGRIMDDDTAAPLLSTREIECLNWAATGKTNDEIGTILSISANTVNSHIKNAGQKLGAHTKMFTIVRAVQLRLVNPPF